MNPPSPLFSVVIICYNYAHLLPNALAALEKQTVRNFEIVFVDNGSIDDSVSVFNQWSASNPDIPITFVEIKENQGIWLGRNSGLEACKGKYFIYNDADDYIISENFMERMEQSASTDPDMLFSSIHKVSEDNTILDVSTWPEKTSHWVKISYQGVFYRTELFKQAVKTPHIFFEDFYGAIMFCAHAKTHEYVPDIYYAYYINTISVSNAGKPKPASVLKDVFSCLARNMPELDEENKTQYVYDCIRHYYSFVLILRNLTYPEIKERYLESRAIMRHYYPVYLKNRLIRLWAENGYQGHFKRNVWIMALLERLDSLFKTSFFMGLLLRVYAKMGK